jgi:cellulose synthase/poly-beta-1,6-N-acetylglucosamine synthase-like glycosyltransferase
VNGFPIYLLIFLVFLNRYLGGVWLKRVKGRTFDAIVEGYEPSVTVIIPVYNEGKGVYRTISSLLEQDYPTDKLNVIVVDDCSKDDSYEWAQRAEGSHPGRVRAIRNPRNVGKRRGINNGVRHTPSEIIVSVDSDVIVERSAVRRLVARFTRPELAAVGGRVNVSNPNENWLTRMQTIKYYFGYEYLKNLERYFSSVMCLSGCLAAYRRHVLVELEPVLENRSVFGIPIKYGEDRFLTRQIVKAGYQTTGTLDAVCWTVVPNTLSKYFSQQLRWRRSNLIDYFCGLSHAWRLHPVVAVHYLSLFAMQIACPIFIVQNVIAGNFFELAVWNLQVLALFGFLYWLDTRQLPAEQRVHPAWFLPALVVMPVVYLLYTPLALFTLDSSNWETRGGTPARAPAEPPSRAVAVRNGANAS